MKILRALMMIALLPAVGTADAQIDLKNLGGLLKKGLEAAPKLTEAAKDIGESEEIGLGDGALSVVLGASPLVENAELQRYVNRVGRWVASQSTRPDLPWGFAVIDTPTVNAFALPGGKVLVSIGLLRKLNSEAELVGVLAHEVAHVMQRHQVQAIQAARKSGALQNIGQGIAADEIARSRAGSNELTAKMANAASEAGIDFVKNGVFVRPLDRSLEYEADRIGVLVAAKAGYDPYGLVSAIQMLSTLKEEESGVSLMMSTHPTPGDRLNELERSTPILDRFAKHPQLEERFAKVMAAVR
jgi:predicted Zn-dependent protease